MTLTPAYGRDYKSLKAVKEAFDADKDFILNNITDQYHGKPVNKSQLVKLGIKEVFVRYWKNRKVNVLSV